MSDPRVNDSRLFKLVCCRLADGQHFLTTNHSEFRAIQDDGKIPSEKCSILDAV